MYDPGRTGEKAHGSNAIRALLCKIAREASQRFDSCRHDNKALLFLLACCAWQLTWVRPELVQGLEVGGEGCAPHHSPHIARSCTDARPSYLQTLVRLLTALNLATLRCSCSLYSPI